MGSANTLTVEECSEARPFEHWSNHIVQISKLRSWSFLSICAKLYLDFENATEIVEKILGFEIITFELVPAISPNSEDKTCDRLSKS